MKKNSITFYTSPVANLLELELREGILEGSPAWGNKNQAGSVRSETGNTPIYSF